MKIVLAFDSFKHCLRAREVCSYVREGICNAVPSAEVLSFPLADGGEGTVDAACRIAGKTPVQIPVTGPLGEPRMAPVLLDNGLAVLEAACDAVYQPGFLIDLKIIRATGHIQHPANFVVIALDG